MSLGVVAKMRWGDEVRQGTRRYVLPWNEMLHLSRQRQWPSFSLMGRSITLHRNSITLTEFHADVRFVRNPTEGSKDPADRGQCGMRDRIIRVYSYATNMG